MNNKLVIIAGEASGDLHGAELIKELKLLDSSLEIFGIGGDKMISNGMKSIYHINDMAFLGFAEVVKHLPFIRKVKKDLLSLVKKENIKTSVLIDYPGFNLSMAKSFHSIGIKNLYYISPQIWAWGKGRIKKIKKLISKMIVLFPFEKEMYTKADVDAEFVGHPLVHKIDNYNFILRDELVNKYKLDADKEILLLLPGSRKQELEKIFGDIIPAAEDLANRFNLQTVIASADNIDDSFFEKFKSEFNFKIIKGDTYNLIKNSKFAIVKSGTSTLETAIIGTPFIVVYKTNNLTYSIGKKLVKIENIALANIVAGKTIVPELIQNDVNPENVFNVSEKILNSSTNYEKIIIQLSQIKSKLLTEGNPSKKAAEIIYAELNAS